MNPKSIPEKFPHNGTGATASADPPSAPSLKRLTPTFCMLLIVAVATAACTLSDHSAEQVQSSPPQVSYRYSSDEGLISANAKAREYCNQYSASPYISGTIAESSDDTKTVTFECVNASRVETTTVAPLHTYSAPPAQTRGYTYYSDTELLQAMQSADAYCAQTGQTASASITTDSAGANVLTYRCIP